MIRPFSIVNKLTEKANLVPIYTGSFSIIGLAILFYSLTQFPSDWTGLLAFAVVACIAELARVELFLSSRFSSVSVSGMIGLAGIIAIGPFAGVLIQSVSGFTTALTTSISRESPQKDRASWIRRSLFNLGMYVVSTACAGFVYYQINNSFLDPAWLSKGIAILGAAAIDAFVNIVILIGVISLQTKRNPREIWRQDFEWTIPITVVGYAIGGGILALAYGMFGILGTVIFLLPILSTSYAFRLYKNNMKVYVENLEGLNTELQETNLDLLESLSRVVDAYDSYTYGHSRQVAIYAQLIAEKMGLTPSEQSQLFKASLLHDIGKVGIKDTIMGKQGLLSEQEYQILKRHPIIGEEIVGRMKGLKDIAPIIRSHHERWDGKGYPDGLEKAEIPLGARVLAVADTMDAIISDRPYRPTRSFREAKEEIINCASTRFDPAVIEALIAVIEDKGPAFFKNSASTVDHMMPLKDKNPTIPRFVIKKTTSKPD
ncbi:MAG: HD-GYP domain-containing protein [Chloroflexi bacterium]|nr:HD-GYP domain-containing protein [Chloroflexota bacterium]